MTFDIEAGFPWGYYHTEVVERLGRPMIPGVGRAGVPLLFCGANMATEVRIVREWDVDEFHRRVLQLEAAGYVSRRETYTVTPEMRPDTGEVTHLHSMELVRVARADTGGRPEAS